MVLTISTTKFFFAEISLGDYNFHRWTSKPTEYYYVNSKQTCKPPELHTIMKKCNGTGLVLKICETKNNVWKRYELSILNGIDNCIKITKIKLDSASLNKKFGTFRDWKALETGYEYSRAMKSHFRKFGNQMSGSGNHLCNYASLLA